MKQIIEKRLEELKKEKELGETLLKEIETRKMEMVNRILRVSGAIQILEEILKGKYDNG